MSYYTCIIYTLYVHNVYCVSLTYDVYNTLWVYDIGDSCTCNNTIHTLLCVYALSIDKRELQNKNYLYI